MQRVIIILALFFAGIISNMDAQMSPHMFGKGIQVTGKDSSFHIKFGFRFQNLFTSEWNTTDGSFGDAQLNFLVRRARFKFDGFVHSKKLEYKFELGLSNRDIAGGDDPQFGNTSRIILDAYLDWNFYKNWSIRFGQGKLPGNRERVISSSSLQFVDRSRLNSRYNLDRDVGIQIRHNNKLGPNFVIKEIFALSQGKGRNVTAGNSGGLDYTFRLEMLPFGEFASKGDYVGSAIKKEAQPKLSVGLTYDINTGNVRQRGQNGGFILNSDGELTGKTLKAIFADLMFKHQRISIMGEYVHKFTSDDSPFVQDEQSNVIGTLYTGTGLNLSGGYMFKNNWEVALRYTALNPDDGVANGEKEYTLGLSKFIVEHKLKIQSDIGFRNVDVSDNTLVFRLQTEIHF